MNKDRARDQERQPVPKKSKLSVPPISDINEAEKISSSIELSVFKKSTTQVQAHSASIVKQVQLSTHCPLPSIVGGQKTKASTDILSNYSPSLAIDAQNVAGQRTDGPSSASIIKPKDTAAPRKPSNPRAIIVNIVQKNNPVMKHVRNVPWELGDIVPDFELGRTVCALFLSVRYHSLHPDYIHRRLKELGKQYELRILLVYVDTSECHHALEELAKVALLVDLTLMLAWSPEEVARYLETYKAYENKPPDLIMERTDSDFSSRVVDSLTTVKKVNKTDAATLVNTFKTMRQLIKASKDDLTMCPGLGPQKAQRLYDLFHQPFLRTKMSKTDS